MQGDFLSTFFQRNMPSFIPRAESFLESVHANDLKNINFRYIFTVKGMLEVSHLIEDTIINTPGVTETHVSFQRFSRISQQHKRYVKVAEASKGLWLYGVPDAPLPSYKRVIAVDTTSTDLEHFWFVIGYGAGFSMTLLAEEIAPRGATAGNEPHYYEGFYTFDANIAYSLLILLHQMFPARVNSPTMPELF